MAHKAILTIEGKDRVVGVYPSQTEAFLEARKTFLVWVETHVEPKDQTFWTKSAESDPDSDFGYRSE